MSLISGASCPDNLRLKDANYYRLNTSSRADLIMAPVSSLNAITTNSSGTENSDNTKLNQTDLKDMTTTAQLNPNATKFALSDLSEKGVKEISSELRELLADVFALYVKTKNFHWHMTGPNFRDYHLLLDDQGEQIFEMSDVVAERIRKLGDVALRSIGDIARHQRVHDNDDPSLTPAAMLTDLLASNQELIKYLRATHDVCDQYNDVATASLIENWIDETEKRAWFLYEILRRA
jgi:starvation-inducible DNA-binding protein